MHQPLKQAAPSPMPSPLLLAVKFQDPASPHTHHTCPLPPPSPLRSTVSDVAVNGVGLVIASVSVVSSGMQQILVGTIQRKYKLASHQLLANTAPMQVGGGAAGSGGVGEGPSSVRGVKGWAAPAVCGTPSGVDQPEGCRSCDACHQVCTAASPQGAVPWPPFVLSPALTRSVGVVHSPLFGTGHRYSW